ncbi:MotA/TolQ/ExbB proton channel family protein [Simkania negevensis]|uniref:MotA/TolQ/ExbB proton channel family protein n=1 Tax=Simkania negevensis TaxID=83561 RepID=A0ABS3ARH1_9BACT|nr:MotA/TolQ/ExbB proton channel family protein [Simkania negevensis]
MKKIFFFCSVFGGLIAATFLFGQSIVHTEVSSEASKLDIGKIFSSAPIIYSLLLALSALAFILWLYSLFTLKLKGMMPHSFLHIVREQIVDKRFEAALNSCQENNNFSSSIIVCGIAARKHGPQVMFEAMQSEGKRLGASLWQRISLLNEIATIAPMLGLLGTVVGLFYAFYDNNRTTESLISIFDGLGIAIGTTVAGLIVAILSMVFYTTLKYRVVRLLNAIENEALSIANLIEMDPPQQEATAALTTY